MPVDSFSKEQFEAALPNHNVTGEKLWKHAGFQKGEHCYIVQPFKTSPFGIFIRSSIKGAGQSADCGKDSIRCHIVDLANNNRPHGSKVDEYTTRVKGWQGRLTQKLRILAGMIQKIKTCQEVNHTAKKAGGCGDYVVPFRSDTAKNPGRCFICCKNPNCKNKAWEWIDPPVEPKEAPKVQKAPKRFFADEGFEYHPGKAEQEAEQEQRDIEGGQE